MIEERFTRSIDGNERDRRSALRERPEPETRRREFRSAALIVNTRSRVGRTAAATALDYLTLMGVPVEAVYAIDDPARLPETVHEAVAEGHDLIVLGGGDGSISSVVDLLAGSDAALGLLPLGTANDFARTVGIPFELERACTMVAQGDVADVDLGLAGGNYYVNVASVGLATGVAQALSPRLKRTVGALAYPVAALRAYAQHEPFAAALAFPDDDHEPVAMDGLLQVAVGNGRYYGGGLVVAPDSGPRDSALDVYAIEAGGPVDLARIAWGLRTGEFVNNERVHHWRTSRVTLATDPPLPINLDGELVSRTPKDFSVAPGALKILVPRSKTPAAMEDSTFSSFKLAARG